MSLINAIDINPSYLIYSVITNKIYLDEERRCFLFFSENEANAFCLEKEDTKVSHNEYRMKKELATSCYAQGAQMINITHNGREESFHLGPNRVALGFYNGSLNAKISLMRETKQKKYLKEVANEKFIVPVRIKNEGKQEIVYGIVRIAEDKPFLYLGFSDIEEYQAWADRVDGWKPLLVTFDTMCQIGKNHGFMINPFGNRFIMNYETMNRYNIEMQSEMQGGKKN